MVSSVFLMSGSCPRSLHTHTYSANKSGHRAVGLNTEGNGIREMHKAGSTKH